MLSSLRDGCKYVHVNRASFSISKKEADGRRNPQGYIFGIVHSTMIWPSFSPSITSDVIKIIFTFNVCLRLCPSSVLSRSACCNILGYYLSWLGYNACRGPPYHGIPSIEERKYHTWRSFIQNFNNIWYILSDRLSQLIDISLARDPSWTNSVRF